MTVDNRIVFLKSKRLYLRPLLESDIPHLMRWINDREVTIFLKPYLPKLEANERAFLENVSKNPSNVVFAIVLVEDDRVIGTMGLHGIHMLHRRASTGAMIGEKDCWGKGYGTEAKMLLLHWAFTSLNLRKINSSVLAFNHRSATYLAKCGYKVIGVYKKNHFVRGRYVDEIILEVFKSYFMPLWREYKKKHLS
ncbi:MAG: GNAT family N-acetyltransferase [Parcubacteria group bacterium]|nr:GNAT family N-acetyltransferase [Parcubacteria group bacterium]